MSLNIIIITTGPRLLQLVLEALPSVAALQSMASVRAVTPGTVPHWSVSFVSFCEHLWGNARTMFGVGVGSVAMMTLATFRHAPSEPVELEQLQPPPTTTSRQRRQSVMLSSSLHAMTTVTITTRTLTRMAAAQSTLWICQVCVCVRECLSRVPLELVCVSRHLRVYLVVVAATEWTLDQVAEWLREILLKQELVPVFASHGIDGAALMQLNNNKMRSMGLTAHQSHQVWRRLVCL